VVREGGHAPLRGNLAEQVTQWWHEAEVAVQAGQVPRARRFLRWVLACDPDDEEAWLWLARLATTPQDQLAYLRQAYAFHPHSKRVQSALRHARAWQLKSAVGELRPGVAGLCCLPDDRYPGDRQAPAGDETSRGAGSSYRPPGLDSSGRSEEDSGRGGTAGGAKQASTPAGTESPVRSRGGRQASRSQKAEVRSWRRSIRLAGQRIDVDLAAWLAFLLPLLVYLLTACSTVYNLDSAEFSAAAHVLGIVRATGYPLYLLLGKLFTILLPAGDVAFRLNAMSAVCAAGTVALLYQLVRRLTQQRVVALAASLLFGFSYYFWTQAVVAEVYTLHTLLMVSLLLLLLRWEESRSDALLAAFGLLFGLSFGNHMSTLLLVPAFGFFLLAVAGTEMFRPKRLAALLVPFIAGLGIYLYIPLRYLAHPPFNYAGAYDATGRFIPLDLTRPANLWWLVSGKGFQQLMFDYTPVEFMDEVGQAVHRLWGSFLGLGVVPGILGAWVQARRRWRHFILFGLIFAANLVFFVNYRVVDKTTMFVPVYLIWAIWIGQGYAALVKWVQGWRQADRHHAPAWAWGLVLLMVVPLFVNWPLIDVQNDTRARDRAQAALSEAGPQAIIFGWWTSAPPIHYLQMVENQRPDVLVINRFLIGADEMYALIDRSLGDRPVYVMELDEGLIGAYQLEPVGPMFELTPRKLVGVEP
jgi:hypothetical protein